MVAATVDNVLALVVHQQLLACMHLALVEDLIGSNCLDQGDDVQFLLVLEISILPLLKLSSTVVGPEAALPAAGNVAEEEIEDLLANGHAGLVACPRLNESLYEIVSVLFV